MRNPIHLVITIWVLYVVLGSVQAQSTGLIAEIETKDIYVGDVVKVYGYVYDNGNRDNLAVSYYLNGRYQGKVFSKEGGYFEIYVPVNEKGYNVLKVKYKNHVVVFDFIAKSKKDVVIKDERYYDKIIIVKDEVYTIYPYQLREKEGIKNQYVDVELSTKELLVGKFGGSLLKINIYNHLNDTSVFEVEIEGLDDKHYYVDGRLELKPLERGTINVYFSPVDREINDEVKLIIKANGKEIDKKSLILKTTKKQGKLYSFEEKKLFFNLDPKAFISLTFIIVGSLLVIYSLSLLRSNDITY